MASDRKYTRRALPSLRTILACLVAIRIFYVGFAHSLISRARRKFAARSWPIPNPPSWPRTIWLMSYPNSGTSYTMHLVKTATMQNQASNYAHECRRNETCSPVHAESPDGPFWLWESQDAFVKPVRGGYTLTKTHCKHCEIGCMDARCTKSNPLRYQSKRFIRACLETVRGDRRADDGTLVYSTSAYSSNLVHGTIHLVRDPLDNIVSRFHDLRKNQTVHDKYPKTREGFRQFCRDDDARSGWLVGEANFSSRRLPGLITNVPCHTDFIRYVVWHNHASVLPEHMGIPGLTLHYEDYETNFDTTLKLLLGFLRQRPVGHPEKFLKGKSYKDYYTEEEIGSVSSLMRELSTNEGWSRLERYFQ